jgi:hypothetical protein
MKAQSTNLSTWLLGDWRIEPYDNRYWVSQKDQEIQNV